MLTKLPTTTVVNLSERPLSRPTFSVVADLALRAALLRDVDPSHILRRDRSRKVAHTRWGVMWVLRRYGLSLVRIASVLNLKDHTSVIHGLRMAEKLRRYDADYRQFTDQLMAYAQLLEPQTQQAA